VNSVGIYLHLSVRHFTCPSLDASLAYIKDSPIEIIIGTIFLYELLGSSAFVGLAVTCLFLPLNHLAGKVVVGAQDSLMKARDERISLMNEILGAIRMLKVSTLRSTHGSLELTLSVYGMGAQI
jgi:hypothetical protein